MLQQSDNMHMRKISHMGIVHRGSEEAAIEREAARFEELAEQRVLDFANVVYT